MTDLKKLGTRIPVAPKTSGNDVGIKRDLKTDVRTDVPTDGAAAQQHAPLDPTQVDAAKKVTGDTDVKRKTGGTGPASALHGLEVVEKKSSSWKGGVAAALIGLAAIGGYAQDAKADTVNNAVPVVTTQQALPYQTGPPSFQGASLLNTRLDSMRATTTTSPAVAAQTQLAFDNLNAAISRIQLADLAGFSSQRLPLGADSELSLDAQRQVERALGDFVKQLPVGSLSPSLVDVIRDRMIARGLSTENLEARPLKDLGSIGGDIAKSIVNDFRHEKPAAFYSLAAAGAAALGTWAYLDGSHVLTSVGIKPEVKLKFLNDHVAARAKVEWQAKLSNPTVSVGVTSTFPVGALTGQVAADVVARGPTFGDLQVNGFRLSSSLQGQLNNGASIGLSSSTVFTGNGGVKSVSVAGSYVNAPWTASAAATYFAQDHRTVGSLSVGYQPRKDVDVFLQGSHDSAGDSRIGVGVRLRF
jgi:hypothetical protein